ncbi:MAG TPA: type 4a pilus biogenesis protein PilO [Bacillota bacterium]|nr:type 4a pilus biogenesis protein PilO [Bacillota bacterium]
MNNKPNNFLGPLILIILLIGVFAGGVILHFVNRNLNATIKKKEQQLIQLQQAIKTYQRERSGKQVIKSEHKRLVGFIPSRENQEEFIWELGKLAQDNNLKIGNCLFDSKLLTLKKLPKYQALQCQVSITGSYQNLLGFIDSLPQIARLVLVSKINLKLITAANNNDPPQFEALFTLDLIASATSVAFSQSSNANSAQFISPSMKALPTIKAAPSPKALSSLKKPTSVKAQPTTQKILLKPSSSPSAKKPPATSPVTNSNTGDSSPFEVKNPPIINPGE